MSNSNPGQETGSSVTPVSTNDIAPVAPAADLRRSSGVGGGGAQVLEDAPSSNTASSSYKEEEKIKILLKGIDSLYFSFQGEIDPGINQELADRKLFAQSKKAEHQAQAVWPVGNHRFEVYDKGQRSGSGGGFAYVLEDAAFRICLAAISSRALPMAYVKVSSAYLAHQRPEEVYRELIDIIGSFGNVEAPTLSRVDIFADFQSRYNMEAFSRVTWVTRAGGFDTHARSGQFTGYSIGMGGNISSRLYNKTLEIRKSNKTYFNELWRRGGVNPDLPIWRQEFEIHREVLNELRILSFDHLLDRLGCIWAYATQVWLRLTVPQVSDCNRARWPMHPLWQQLSEVRWRLDDQPLIRRFTMARLPDEARLCRFLISYITSFMALKQISDFDAGAKQAIETARQIQEAHCQKRLAIDFDEWVYQQVAIKSKHFNLPFGGDSARRDADREVDAELEAIGYFNASRGM